ncbi:MAG: hypothetical protein AVO33_01340 [delta proteobacterium ML8_F1]|nr:MAG: hypothetical protein AVO33_01340 [delta proteobacterium ML8_F1]
MEDRQYEDEISLKELIMALIKNWKLIVAFIVVAGVLALGYVMVIADEVYEASLEGSISVPESVRTRYGSYSFPTTDKMDFLNVVYSNKVIQETIDDLGLMEATVNGFKNAITLETEEKSTRFTFKVTGGSPEEAELRLLTLAENLEDELRIIHKEAALISFIRDYGVSYKNLEENLLQTQTQLEEIQEEFADIESVITLRKLVTSDPVYAAELAQNRGVRIEELSEEMMLEEVINPHYDALQGTLINLRKEIQNIVRAMEKNLRYTDELKAELSNVQAYVLSGDGSKMDKDMVAVMETTLHFSASTNVSDHPIAPKKALTLAIALVLGAMLGVFVAFFKEYWQNSN